ncbi:MAG: hypothetical protein ABSG98_06195 [Anaerolineales bacterium]|jgi:hypothetical protein
MAELRGIPAKLLVLDPDVQARACQDPQQIARLRMSDCQAWPPLLVTPNPDPKKPGTYLVIDGAHRFLAGQHLDSGKAITVYPCEVREGLGYEDSAEANLTHLALQLSTADRCLYGRYLKEENPTLSNREIGRRVGVHHTTIATYLAKDPAASVAKSRKHIPRLVGLMVQILEEGEGTGFLGLGNRAETVAKTLLARKDIHNSIKAVKTWVSVLERAVEIVEAMPEETN